MKTFALLAFAAALTSCTTTTQNPTTADEQQRKQRELTEKRVYTREDLARSGQAETGEALQKVDPNVTVSRPR